MRLGDLAKVPAGRLVQHLIRFFRENLSLFGKQLPPDHGASLTNA